jgi:hypothetical protein
MRKLYRAKGRARPIARSAPHQISPVGSSDFTVGEGEGEGGDGGGGGAVPSASGARWQRGCCDHTGRWIIADGGDGVHRSRLGFGGVTP